MTRIIQPLGTRGSLKWMQRLVEKRPELLTSALANAGGLQAGESVNWVSPRAEDNYAEYRDGDFLAKLGLSRLHDKLLDFWPRGGPQWDGLGLGNKGTVVLVEAKAHLAELTSTCQASPESRKKIEAALQATKAAMRAPADANWLEGFYQYANRLAHLHFLRQQGVQASLAFIYFNNDADMRGPASAEEWFAGLGAVTETLGLPPSYKQFGVKNIFIDVGDLAD